MIETSILILIVLLAIAVVWGLYRFKRETETQPTRHFSGMQNDGRAEAFMARSDISRLIARQLIG